MHRTMAKKQSVARGLIRSGKTVESLVRAIADDIVSGRLDPGARLDESSLATRYEVSRTPVREALGQLSAIGLIDRRPNRGAVVAVLSDELLASMFEAMTELEAICARLSAERISVDRISTDRDSSDRISRHDPTMVRAAVKLDEPAGEALTRQRTVLLAFCAIPVVLGVVLALIAPSPPPVPARPVATASSSARATE